MLRRAVLALALLAAAAGMSGCWGRVAGPTGGHQVLVIKPAITDRIISDATGRCGTGQGRGGCALGTIRALCLEVPLSETNPISEPYCWSITWTDHYDDVEGAIRQVIGPDHDCLAAEMGIPGSWGDWFALPLGAYGCKN
jgi:hypothetical protein